ncbi:MAG TPA: hypothetical protein VFO18_03535 [Methylomirabilota bacterium]|nr:hypothetical protein [Methylomirabilota bacterium]
MLVAISIHGGKGRDKADAWSQNLMKAFECVKRRGGTTIGLVGFDGATVREVCGKDWHASEASRLFDPDGVLNAMRQSGGACAPFTLDEFAALSGPRPGAKSPGRPRLCACSIPWLPHCSCMRLGRPWTGLGLQETYFESPRWPLLPAGTP